MMWRDVVTLIDEVSTVDDIGDQQFMQITFDVFANKKSVRQSEFYQAFAHGFRPEIMFEVRSIDYNNQTLLRFNYRDYSIIRSFSKNDEVTELICTGIVPKGSI
jgi:hypothetical protein